MLLGRSSVNIVWVMDKTAPKFIIEISLIFSFLVQDRHLYVKKKYSFFFLQNHLYIFGVEKKKKMKTTGKPSIQNLCLPVEEDEIDKIENKKSRL